MNQYVKIIFRFLFFLGIGVAILYWLYTSQENAYQIYCAENHIAPEDCSLLGKLYEDFSSVKYSWVFLVLIFYMMSNVSRILRWMMMLKSIGHPTKFKTAFIATMTGYFINSLIPRAGELARPGYVSFVDKTPIEKIIGTIAIERAIDVLFLISVMGLGFFLEFDMLYDFVVENMGDPKEGLLGSPLILGLGVVGLIVVIFGFVYRGKLRQNKIFNFVENKLKGVWEGVMSVRHVEKPWLFILHSLNIWFMYYLMTYVGFFAFSATEHLSAETGIIVFIFGTLGIVIPSPGGLGAYQYLVTTCLDQFYGLEYSDAFSFSNIAFWPIYFLNIILGLILLPFAMSYFSKKDDGKTEEKIN